MSKRKDIVEYKVSSFKDFAGLSHGVVICSLSSTPYDCCDTLTVGWADVDYVVDCNASICDEVIRTVSIGISICNPNDVFDVEIGKKIAYNKAKDNTPCLFATKGSVVNSLLVNALMDQELDRLSKYPHLYIAGYENAKKAYENKLECEKMLENLDPLESETIEAINSGVDVDKCLKLAKYLNENYN